MTKQDLKRLIREAFSEVVAEDTYEEAKSEKKAEKKTEPKKVEPKEPETKVTKNLVQQIDKHEKKNKSSGEKSDAELFGRIGKMLRKRVGQTLEQANIEEMLAELDCEECYEEGSDSIEEKMDPVGKEDGDINNDGKKDGTDKYLMKRRKAIGAAIEKGKKLKKK